MTVNRFIIHHLNSIDSNKKLFRSSQLRNATNVEKKNVGSFRHISVSSSPINFNKSENAMPFRTLSSSLLCISTKLNVSEYQNDQIFS